MPNHSYYQGTATQDQSVKPAANNMLDLVCCDCGADKNACHHMINDDYVCEPRQDYETMTTFYRRFLYAAGVVLVVCVIMLVSLASR